MTATTDDRAPGPDGGGTAPAADRTPPGRRRLDPDALAALEDQRDFLLRSLDDLEREHDAGDVDDRDYETLKDDYTARAARTIRAIESHQARLAATRRPRSWRRVAATVAGVTAFAVLAGVLVAQASGRREAGDSLTGDIRQSTRTQLAEAVDLASQQRYDEAIEIYDDVLADQPDNAEALTYRGWFQYQSGDTAGAVDSLTASLTADPDYPDTHAFLAVILSRAGQTELALEELDRLDALDPPPEILQLVAPLRERLESEAGAETSATTAPAGPSSPTSAPSP
ncbi:MAG: tetratricopeptide repeat protein [Acidimicrobiales bacterium]|nr:tetratricopeptide repeat protein [Acidimicrobiales bacterium]